MVKLLKTELVNVKVRWFFLLYNMCYEVHKHYDIEIHYTFCKHSGYVSLISVLIDVLISRRLSSYVFHFLRGIFISVFCQNF